MSILIENNFQVIKAIRKIEQKAQTHFPIEGDEDECNKEIFMDLIENTIRIIDHLQKKGHPDLASCKEICMDELISVMKELKLKSTTYFMSIYQNILNGRFDNFAL